MSRTASRALDLLEHVARLPEPAGLIEIAAAAELDKSTAARLLGLLTDRGLVARDPDSRRYAVGPALLALGAAALQRSDLRSGARPYLERLRGATSETVTLHVRVSDSRVCIDGVESPLPIRRAVPLGETIPLTVGASSKAILAFLPGPELKRHLQSAAAGTDVRELCAQLVEVRRLGYSARVNDRVQGVSAMSAPIFDGDRPHAALTVAGPAERWTLERMHEHGAVLTAMAAEMSAIFRSAAAPAA
jgi:DNA-binding IclR family transcriptional regulator